MSKIIKLRKGLDIKLQGEARRHLVRLPLASAYGVSPSDFEGVKPKLLVRQGDPVKVGTPLFFDKNHPRVLFVSPVSGTVEAVLRGEKRKILEVVVQADGKQETVDTKVRKPSDYSPAEMRELLLDCGLWPYIIQRPYGIIADPSDNPKAIFVSGFDSAPLAPDMDFLLESQADNLKAGFDALARLTDGKVHIGVKNGNKGVAAAVANAEQHIFEGPHPAGNVGVQIHHVDPINKGEVVWTVGLQDVAVIGRLFATGRLDFTRTYAVTGSEITEPEYVSAVAGAPFAQLLQGRIKPQADGQAVRIISGNPLTGKRSEPTGYVGWGANQITVIPEGDHYELLGWIMPRTNKFSVSRSYFSWLMPRKRYDLDTNLNGGHRPYIMTGIFERYLPMDIYPAYLLKAILAGDIDKMENLGIYEVVEEDFALCEFADPSKNDVQKTIREGINLMIKELN